MNRNGLEEYNNRTPLFCALHRNFTYLKRHYYHDSSVTHLIVNVKVRETTDNVQNERGKWMHCTWNILDLYFAENDLKSIVIISASELLESRQNTPEKTTGKSMRTPARTFTPPTCTHNTHSVTHSLGVYVAVRIVTIYHRTTLITGFVLVNGYYNIISNYAYQGRNLLFLPQEQDFKDSRFPQPPKQEHFHFAD